MKNVPLAFPRLRPLVFASALAFLALGATLQAAAPSLVLRKDDVWVMAGDSITAQRLHTNFIEAYYQTRFPQLHLRFRNSGIGGNRTNHVLARFEADIAAWKPTIVSIELGMNDVNNGEEPTAYLNGIRELLGKIRAIPAQPVLISSSPVDDGSLLGDWRSERCRKIHPYTEALQKLAAEENVVFVDQYHPLIDLWGNNRRKGAELAEKNGTWPPPAAKPAPAPNPAPNGAPPTPPGGAPKPPQNSQNPPPPIAPALIPLGGDPVHPGPVGQYHMAAVILRGLGAPGEVSSAVLRADGRVLDARGCKISDIQAKPGRLSFTRLDDASPWPILPAAKATLELMPSLLELSAWELKIAGLPEGRYEVRINEKPAVTLSAKDLAAGWNMSSIFQGAVAERSTTITGIIFKLQAKLNSEWREASKLKDDARLAAAQGAIDQCDAELSAAVQPVPWRFEILPATDVK